MKYDEQIEKFNNAPVQDRDAFRDNMRVIVSKHNLGYEYLRGMSQSLFPTGPDRSREAWLRSVTSKTRGSNDLHSIKDSLMATPMKKAWLRRLLNIEWVRLLQTTPEVDFPRVMGEAITRMSSEAGVSTPSTFIREVAPMVYSLSEPNREDLSSIWAAQF